MDTTKLTALMAALDQLGPLLIQNGHLENSRSVLEVRQHKRGDAPSPLQNTCTPHVSWQVERAKRFIVDFIVVEELMDKAHAGQAAMTAEERVAQRPITQLLGGEIEGLLEGLEPSAEASGDPPRYMVWLRRVSACLLQVCTCAP